MATIIDDILDPIQHSYNIALAYFTKPVVQNAEKIYILESANYTANIYKKTLGAGAQAFITSFPYGWDAFTDFWGYKAWLRPFGVYSSSNGLNYMKFPTLTAGVMFVCEFLVKNNNNPGAWNSSDPSTQANYNASINNVQNDYITG